MLSTSSMTIKGVFRLAGLSAVVAGLLFALIQFIPPEDSGLLTVGVLATLSAAIIPAMARPSAVLFGLGMTALGYSLLSKAGRA